MKLKQEIASVIKFVLDSAGNPTPYYYSVPQSFAVPAVYFPSPEVATGGETLSNYRMEYAWYITFHHKTSDAAYDLALAALSAIKGRRNLIPLIAETGEYAGRGLRVKDPSIKIIDVGVCQMSISFVSRRPYDDDPAQKMTTYEVKGWSAPSVVAEYVELTDENGFVLTDENGTILVV